MKYLIYARVSDGGSHSQAAETSIPMQIDMCRRYIDISRGQIINTVQDEFFSGKDRNRPGLSQVLSSLEADAAEWETLIVYRLDRLTRNLMDGGYIFDLLRKHGKGFISITENIDFSSPIGRAMMSIINVFAQFEREQIAERTKHKMVSIAERGGWPTGRPPFGYKRGEKKDNNLYIDPRNSEIVRDVFSMYSSDRYKTLDIIKKYNGTISKKQILDMLKNETYLGYIVYDGQRYKGNHPAIINETLFNAVKSKLPQAHLGRVKSQSYEYLLTGLIKCSCGRYMTPKSAKSGQYHYYVCTDSLNCKAKISAPDIETAVIEEIKKLQLDEELIKEICNEVEINKLQFVTSLQPELSTVTSAISIANGEQKRIEDAFLSGLVTQKNKEFWNDKLSKVLAEIERLKLRHSELSGAANMDIGIYADAKKLTEKIRFFAESLLVPGVNGELKRSAILANIEEIKRVDDRTFSLEFTYNGTPKRLGWGG